MALRAGEELPVPRRERWQPLRAGLVDLFYYDYQAVSYTHLTVPTNREV